MCVREEVFMIYKCQIDNSFRARSNIMSLHTKNCDLKSVDISVSSKKDYFVCSIGSSSIQNSLDMYKTSNTGPSAAATPHRPSCDFPTLALKPFVFITGW